MAQPAVTTKTGMHFYGSRAGLRSGDGVSAALARLASSRLRCFQQGVRGVSISSVNTTSRQLPSLTSVPDLGRVSCGALARVRGADDLNRGFASNKNYRRPVSSFPAKAKVLTVACNEAYQLAASWLHWDAVVFPSRPSLEVLFLLIDFVLWLCAFLSMTIVHHNSNDNSGRPICRHHPHAGSRLEHTGPSI